MSTTSGAGRAGAKGFGLMSAIGLGMNVMFPLMTYDDLRKHGKNKAYAGGVAAAEFVGWNVAPAVMMGYQMTQIVPALMEAGYVIGKENMDKVRGSYSRNFGGKYVDTQQNMNMRQAGMMNINQSREMVGQALGSKAKSYYTHNIRQSREYSPTGDSKRYYTSQLGSEAKSYYHG
jgi:hypothetical protein